MNRFIKVILLLVTITMLRLFWSCCSCDDDYFSFEYERVLISNIDNSGQWSKPSDVNIMPADETSMFVTNTNTDEYSHASSIRP
jgi:hypothetical protein